MTPGNTGGSHVFDLYLNSDLAGKPDKPKKKKKKKLNKKTIAHKVKNFFTYHGMSKTKKNIYIFVCVSVCVIKAT